MSDIGEYDGDAISESEWFHAENAEGDCGDESEDEEIITHGMVVDFGKHCGKLYTRIPVSYLKWMVQSGHNKADVARAELERRGTVTPTVEISGHAIDSASLRLRKKWHETAKPEEGLHAWLVRMCEDALMYEKPNAEGVVCRGGIKFVFEPGEWPILKTCMSDRKTSGKSGEVESTWRCSRCGGREWRKVCDGCS